jgi:hypothetical protein
MNTTTVPPPNDAVEITLDGHDIDEVITLRGGVRVRLAVLRVLWSLEERGISFRLNDRGQLVANPRESVTEADAVWLRAHLAEAKAVVAYQAPEL